MSDGHMQCVECGVDKDVNDFATPDVCEACFHKPERRLLAEPQPLLGSPLWIIEEKPHTATRFTPTQFCGHEPSSIILDYNEALNKAVAYDEAFPLWDHRVTALYREEPR